MGTYSYFTFTETARQAFDLSEALNDPEYQEGAVNGVSYILKLNHPIQAFDQRPTCLESIAARYAVAWSGLFGVQSMAGVHAKHTLSLDYMIDGAGMSEDWANKPTRFGDILSREQLAKEAGVVLPSAPEPTPEPDISPSTAEGLARIIADAMMLQRDYSRYPDGIGWIDDEDLTEVVIDGRVDLLAVANVVLANLGTEQLLTAAEQALVTIEKHVPKTTFAPRMMLREAIAQAKGEQA